MPKLQKIRSLSSFFIYLFVLTSFAYSQSTSASLNGSVVDGSGAAIPGAKITIKNLDTNLVQTTANNAAGVYTLSPLPPGRYTITAERQGFQRYVQTGIVLTVGEAATANITLQPGDVHQTVMVTANAELINTTSAEISSVVNRYSVTQLPLNGRDPSSLVLLSAGVTNVLNTGGGSFQTGFAFPTETGASANGGRQGSTYYLLDGVPNMDTYLQLAAPFPNADATQEFRVISNNFDARYGFAPGAVVTIETRSGGNKFHGGIFEFIRNNDLNAGNYFTHAVDSLKRNQFGGDIGGPILKDKLFFFANYQGTRSVSNAATNTTYTPTAAMLNGDFSAVPYTLKGPFHTVNGKPNQVDPSMFSPAAVMITKTGLPLGQDPATGETNYVSGKVINNYDEGTARIDYNLTPGQRLTLRSFIDHFNQPSGAVNGNLLSVLALNPYTQIMNEPMAYFNEVLSHTWTISPSMVNVFSGFWTQMSTHSSAAVNDSNGQAMCLSRYIKVNELPGQCYLEGLSVTNGFSSGWTEPSQEVRTTWGLSDDLTKTIGNHTLSFGINAWHQYAQEISQYPTQPIISFYGSYTGEGLADWLLGYAGGFTQGAGEIANVRGWQLGLFAQDQYRIRPNLTLTAGLRWDPNLPPSVAGGRGAAFHPGEQSTIFPNAPQGLVFPGDPGVDASLMPTTYGYFEPRLGIAWQPRALPHTSIRSGFGLFTAPLSYSTYNHTADISPFSPTYTFYGSSSTYIPFQDPWSYFGGTNHTSPFPPFSSLSTKPAKNSSFATPISIPAIFSNDFKLGTTASWNLSIEQQIGQNMALHLAYVGSESYHQTTVLDQNPGIYAQGGARSTYSQFANILTDFSNGTASYHSLQVGFEKRMSHNLQFRSNFTWSKTMDLSASGNITFGSPQLGDPFDLRWNRGISYLNVPLISISNFVYTTPALKSWNPIMQNILGNWEVSGIVTMQSGSPFGIAGGGSNNNSGAQQYGDRADVVPGQVAWTHRGNRQQWLTKYFNTAAFTTNAPGTFGTSGKNIFVGPAVKSADLGLMKNWNIAENYQLQFRWEMFNALNHPSFGTPVNNPTAGNFGQITGIGAIPPRVMQGALKLNF
ncbi:MAG: TonB-dependent receptor [Acidobacteriaceae bacterium]